jgi:protein involved in polysaccharide export with SLBB domain
VTPGRYPLTANTSVTEAIAIAGGIRAKVKLQDVSILRTSDGTTQTLHANVSDIMAGKSPNVPIQNGDSVFIAVPSERPDVWRIASVAASIAWIFLKR